MIIFCLLLAAKCLLLTRMLLRLLLPLLCMLLRIQIPMLSMLLRILPPTLCMLPRILLELGIPIIRIKTNVIPEIGQSDQGMEDPIAMPRLNHQKHPMLMSYHPQVEKAMHIH